MRKELERELLGVLRDRLELAVSNCNSYGLDETAGDARPGPSYVAREPARDALASTSGGYGSGGAGLRHSLPMDTSPVQLPRSHRGAGGSVFYLSSSPVAKVRSNTSAARGGGCSAQHLSTRLRIGSHTHRPRTNGDALAQEVG